MTLDEVKAEMIKDLKFHNQRVGDDSLAVEEVDRSTKGRYINKLKQNEKLIDKIKQRRNIFNR